MGKKNKVRFRRLILSRAKGDIGVMSMLLALFMAVAVHMFCRYAINCRVLRLDDTILTDGLEISNLSAAVMDEDTVNSMRFGSIEIQPDGGFILKNASGDSVDVLCLPEETFNAFTALCSVNVSGGMCDPDIKNLHTEEFILYNVKLDGSVDIYDFNGTSPLAAQTVMSGAGKVTAPDGTTVTKTSIYSRVRFDYTDYFGMIHHDMKSECCTAVRVTDLSTPPF